MGFKLPKRTAILEFEEGHEYHGLVIELNLRIPMGDALRWERGEFDEDTIRDFADRTLLSWNLEDDEGPVPANADGLMRQDAFLGMLLLKKWLEAAAQPSAPLGEPSANGSTSEEARAQTAPRSLSRVS